MNNVKFSKDTLMYYYLSALFSPKHLVIGYIHMHIRTILWKLIGGKIDYAKNSLKNKVYGNYNNLVSAPSVK